MAQAFKISTRCSHIPMNNTSTFSLLQPASATTPNSFTWGSNVIADLDLEKIADAAHISPQYRKIIKQTLLNVSADPQVIEYRQQVLADFLNARGIADGFTELLPALARLHDSLALPTLSNSMSIQETLGRLSELYIYVNCVRKLEAILAEAGDSLRSRALLTMRSELKNIITEETFQSLEKTLPGLIARLKGIPSITVGINLDHELRPVEATLLSVNDKPFKGGSLLQQLIGKKTTNDKPDQGIAQLHSLPFIMIQGGMMPISTGRRVDPVMVPLFKDLFDLLRNVIDPISSALKNYAKLNASFLVSLEEEVAFYLGALRLMQKMQAVGLPICQPEILPTKERVCTIQGLYNLRLALDMQHDHSHLHGVVVQNDVDFGEAGRIFILTGPNQGGKTVYTQSVGIAQVLFQAGLHIPAESAHLSPVDGLYTHFAVEEKSIQGMGRLSEESKRLSDIFETMTPHSLVLLNESFSSTSASESLYMSKDVVRALRLFGVRAIFATHLHELAESVETINRDISGESLVISVVAEVDLDAEVINDLVPRTYKVRPGPPRGHSYAKGIAVRYGVSFEQLAGKWQERSR